MKSWRTAIGGELIPGWAERIAAAGAGTTLQSITFDRVTLHSIEEGTFKVHQPTNRCSERGKMRVRVRP